jgi:hypothetical protein
MRPAVHCFGGMGSHEGEASELWGLRVHAEHSEHHEAVGPASAHLHWKDRGGKQRKLACGEYEGVNLVTEREWVLGEVLSFLEQVGPSAWWLGGC